MKLLKKTLSVVLVVLILTASVVLNATFVYADSYETAIFPGGVLKVTQGAYGEYNSYSHNGQGGYYQNAFDLVGNSNYVAPFSGSITKIKTSYNAVIFQSDDKVYWADGSLDYMSVCFVHDNDISDLYVGKHINQGEIFYQPGVKDPGGYTTGTHLHICVNRGKTNAGLSIFSGDVRPNEAFFLNSNTSVQQTGGYSWKYSDDFNPSYTIADITNGEYYFKNVATGKYLAVDGGKDAQAQNVSVADFTGGNEMKFSVVSESNGYALRPLCSSSRMLNIYADNVVSGKNVCIYDNTGHSSQRWQFESVDGGYIIHSSNNSSCVLDVNGSNVQVSSKSGANSQKWVLEPIKLAVLPDKPMLEVVAGTTESDTVFKWEKTANTDSYTLHLYDETNGEKYPLFDGIIDLSIAMTLPAGDYSAFVASINDDLKNTNLWYSVSDSVTFSVVDIHEHNYYIIEESEPCCQSYGYTKYECECGDVYTETGTELGDHIAYDEWTVLKVPTETTYGIACKLCKVCSVQVEYATIDINGNIIDNTTTEPTPPVNDYPLGIDVDAYIADKNTGDVMFTWNAQGGETYYFFRIFDNNSKEIVSERIEEPCYLWSPITTENGMFTIESYNSNGELMNDSSFVDFSINTVMADWWGEYGDVDLNSKVNIKDATLIQKYAAKLAEIQKAGLGAADVNGDGKVNVKDATAIQKYLANIYTDTSVGESYHYGFTEYDILLEK